MKKLNKIEIEKIIKVIESCEETYHLSCVINWVNNMNLLSLNDSIKIFKNISTKQSEMYDKIRYQKRLKETKWRN